MSWLSIVPKFVRKSIFNMVDEQIRAYANAEAIKGYVVLGVNTAIDAAKDKADPAKIEKWADGCEKGANVFSTVAAAIKPSSENGVNISEAEGREIVENIEKACGVLVPQEFINGVVEKAENKVKELLLLK